MRLGVFGHPHLRIAFRYYLQKNDEDIITNRCIIYHQKALRFPFLNSHLLDYL